MDSEIYMRSPCTGSLDIQFSSQGFSLSGSLHLPSTQNPPLVIGSHGLEGSKESGKQQVLAKTLVQHGIAFFRFDHRGCGQSQGNFLTDTSLEKRTQDLLDAIQHVLSLNKTSKNIALFGSSMGGATCINAWSSVLKMDLELKGAVLCSAPIQSLTIENIPTQATDNRPALPLSFFAENLLFDLTDKISNLSHLLIFHGDKDEVVPVENAKTIYNLAKDPKKLIIQKNGDHRMSSKKDQAQFDNLSVEWFSNLLKQ